LKLASGYVTAVGFTKWREMGVELFDLVFSSVRGEEEEGEVEAIRKRRRRNKRGVIEIQSDHTRVKR
jgi:hypothetical protein